jgi:ketosteroid isomerase-like protein
MLNKEIMTTSNAKQAAENLLIDYAEVLNTANTLSIASFYTFDGLFMPEGYSSIKAGNLTKVAENYLKKHDFEISYTIQNISEADGLIFVQARANTKIKSDTLPDGVQRSSRDFFILRKEDAAWKIYRYIFNQDHQ